MKRSEKLVVRSQKSVVGLIGFGRFGKLLAEHLSKRFSIVVFDENGKNGLPEIHRFASLEEVASQKIIILAVPINQLQNVLKKISPLIQKDALVIDVCSVKEKPIAWMKKLLPKSVSILGTHPMFGPDSAAKGLKGKTIVLCPTRISPTVLKPIFLGLFKEGLEVITASPKFHDEQVAHTQALVHFFARSWNEIKFPRTIISTLSFERQNEISITLMNDSEELFLDMHRYNRFSKEAREKMMSSLKRVDSMLV
ncbi:MAG: prephenate dehydrogenase [Ignavibacteriales bacterium]|nr:prephenate dehydrogenase [Ignavibacteriales bacterium]